ncbi:MAG: acyltransferase family protein [Pseudomonadota bacterium]
MQIHRADIEGLRALAVLLVILYHYQFPGISGGFIGVDVFFVISGFVITQLLSRELTAGTFRFSEFYARRIRRLVPVFLLVSTATFLMISPFYLDEDYYVFAKSWLASLIGLSNFYYFGELNQYFAPEAQSLSLLHTWSLAVEEQFYLLWPGLLVLIFPFLQHRQTAWCFALLWMLTLALSITLAITNVSAAYYLLPARAFELLLGAGVALFGAQLPTLSRRAAEGLALSGLLLIGGTALFLHSDDHFPGYNALWPTLGAALIITTGVQHPHTWVARALSMRGMVFLGGISYSLYLWHWPPVALLHYQLIELTWPLRLLLIAGVVLLAWLSFHYVENRYRYRPWSLKKSFALLIFLPLFGIWIIQSTIRIADDLSFRIPEERRELYRIIAQNNAGDLYVDCFKGDDTDFDQSDACRLGVTKDGMPNAILVGDSHATSMAGFLDELLQSTDLSALLVTAASTPFLAPEDARQVFADDEEKVARNVALGEYLSNWPMTVFLSAWWNAYLEEPEFQQYFLSSIEWLLQHQHRIVMLEDAPELPSTSFAYCLLKNMADCSVDASEVNERLQNFNQFKQAVQRRYPQVQWINPRAVLCDQERCQTVLDGTPLYRDENHLNDVGSRLIGRLFLERFGNPLLLRQ